MKKFFNKALYLATIANLVTQHGYYVSAEEGKCEKANQFECKSAVCGTTVSDCMQCDGYLNTDINHKLCFNRKLFNNNIEKDPDHHYPYLINDIIGMIVWFLAAGVATACGVGGGGIYVPLGIILLRFASKPATGLSQASIFGASLGGLVLNIRDTHPDDKIRDMIGQRDEDGRVIPYDKNRSTAEAIVEQEAYLNSGNGRKFYTRPLIDYDMALFLAPMEMAGAVLGVIIQKLLPNWLFLSMAGVILGVTSYKTYKKFFVSYQKDKENREKRRLADAKDEASPNADGNGDGIDDALGMEYERLVNDHDENNVSGEQSPLVFQNENDQLTLPPVDLGLNVNMIAQNAALSIHEDFDEDVGGISESHHNEEEPQQQYPIIPDYNESHDDPEKLKIRREMLEDDMRQYPIEKLIYLVILWIGLAFIIFLKGGKGVDSIIGITCSSPFYALLIACQFIWTLGFAGIFGYKLVKKHEAKVACDYPFHTNDVLWDVSKLRFYALFTFIAGIVAGLIGIGGGMVLGPLMLILGVHPRVSSATTATMIVLTSSSVAVMFVTSGLVPWEYAATFFCICLVGAYIGKKYIDSYVKKTGMSSILIGILATIIGFATIGCFVIVILNLSKANWCFDGFKPFCVEKDDGVKCALTELMKGLNNFEADIKKKLSQLP